MNIKQHVCNLELATANIDIYFENVEIIFKCFACNKTKYIKITKEELLKMYNSKDNY